ncbi:AAA-domain-containing protein [Aureobasidium pullulans]|uniref:AAA-domain-containing protein n=1 Tax=Aureobasidium pullulans TaxID=5580 RepID=A0A4S9PZ30_AURPU|nr:AAA-domain-containing protein [Aureobasidium pullulans]THZ45230.1 AAA-domain-containing protein [Aureobasidium pullulans]THZ63692.1 AAA-domain-containing protein [Aureobasidium pullulans]THZ88796.1 AAA-domain-containing protein [Aureobasidium pullulans]
MNELHVELRLKDIDDDEAYIPRSEIEDAFHAFLTNDYIHPVNEGEELVFNNFKYHAHVNSVRVTGTDVAPKDLAGCFLPSKVQLEIHAYDLNIQDTLSPTAAFGTSADAKAKIISIPHESLDKVWENLKFDETQNINLEQILSSVVRTVMLLHHANGLQAAMNINRLMLFHGPPGCGKSTLCRALAHKLVIRLGRTFRSGKLFEINTQDLLSKFYSESGKLVSDMFDKILRIAQDEKELVCVLIDEIESIAASRQASTRNGECADTVRATNQLLTALDRIRCKPNIVVFCTSNLLESIDTAFLDRLYDAIPVPPPCASAVYTILSNILNSLIDAGAIIYKLETQTPEEDSDFVLINAMIEGQTRLPDHGQLLLLQATYPDTPGPLLKAVADTCAGFSGRKLSKLPFLAITKYTRRQCNIFDAIKALGIAIKQELVH